MATIYARRYRRSSSSAKEAKMFKKDNQPEAAFFGKPSHESFFKPAAIQRKCDQCDAEDKKINRIGADEEKKIQKTEDKKEEEVHRQPDHKEEEKKIQKAEDKKEEEVHRQPDHKEEEKKIQKAEDKKEEEVHRQPDHKEEEKKIYKAEDKKEEEVHRQADHKEEEKKIAKKESSAPSTGLAATGAYIQSLNGKGSSLPKDALNFFNKMMGYDFSSVKIHTNTEAEQSARGVNAKAYAVDNNIVFNKGQYNPVSTEGKKLLAHELTHVIQQKENAPDLLSRVAENTEQAKEVDAPSDMASAPVTDTQNTATKNTASKGCADAADVHGHTDANYTDAFNYDIKSDPSTKCSDCVAPDCISARGIIVSKFKTNPVINLPSIPNGLTDCETKAVDKFINTTLKNHEQKHVTAFKSYDGTIRTPYRFTGCQSDLDNYVNSQHDAIKAQRQSAADALSSALDTPPFSPTIPCDC